MLEANGRCDQENLIAQLKSGVHALTAPVDDLVSNWAYMVMASPGLEPEGVGGACCCRSRRGTPRSTGPRSGRCCGWSSRRSARR